ncbi:Arc family DNA-binding protein [Methylobacterium sp. WL30]|uniref:Arc family DNA-binding protein n=1 Tax=unclassified Methylobacterium TaxID=2615210 RepID=UPI0011CB4744|nr:MULTISPECIES: Arc family DNA-binding protein [unclassified Methylobacterium]TXN41424.1 Arc family DNA-binding protein [Methylobacterium sp. WL93]TXN49806.1 Arc family DNA-binding protein [Methylobacterium sp. WL119]TXN62766.1 Arc family DNA-binding protein [Methylobacterium sp. WL30]
MSRKLPEGEGKRVPLNMRSTRELRDRLETAAEKSGRSIAQEVEFRLEQSFRESDLHAILLGGDRTAKLLQYISTAIKTSVSKDGRNWENDPALANTVGMAFYYLTLSCSKSHLEAIGMMRGDEDFERRAKYAAQIISNQTILSYRGDLDQAGDEKAGIITAPQAIQRFIVDGEKV